VTNPASSFTSIKLAPAMSSCRSLRPTGLRPATIPRPTHRRFPRDANMLCLMGAMVFNHHKERGSRDHLCDRPFPRTGKRVATKVIPRLSFFVMLLRVSSLQTAVTGRVINSTQVKYPTHRLRASPNTW
jgi:hypothetical protein